MYTEELARRMTGRPAEGEEEAVEQRLQIAVMLEGKRCDLGEIILEPDDYLINEQIKHTLQKGDEVLAVQISDEAYVILMKVVES